ncbi:hypothetical protein VNO77_04575 [Canavalia gladiata]|uniref:Transmembrane protein n=1 Tax=Canavalia gladiata TaxID=3824 RepID=A0AAN9MXK3_CANGL
MEAHIIGITSNCQGWFYLQLDPSPIITNSPHSLTHSPTITNSPHSFTNNHHSSLTLTICGDSYLVLVPVVLLLFHSLSLLLSSLVASWWCSLFNKHIGPFSAAPPSLRHHPRTTSTIIG